MANEQTLPDDIDALKALVRAQRLELERLKIQLARLRRTQFGRSSEQLAAEIRQLELALDALSGETRVTPLPAPVTPHSSSVPLERSTLADRVGGASALLSPLVEALGAYVMDAEKLHADDTPVPVLAPGTGRTRTGRLWTYVRDDRPSGDDAPPAAWFRYSADRKGEHPARHLRAFRGVL